MVWGQVAHTSLQQKSVFYLTRWERNDLDSRKCQRLLKKKNQKHNKQKKTNQDTGVLKKYCIKMQTSISQKIKNY